ncbi:hypothetical protein [Lysinibacillus telephonicus]|uniref:hypothetical protein n=1 Tax=Lysinibacillus telephonicus TaxID=1714840 RepID=UPI003B9F5BFE
MRTLQTELIKKGLFPVKRDESKRRQPTQVKKVIVKPKMSTREIEELIGIHRDRYRRVKGSFQRK